jgi:hypothetical protein
MALKTWVAGEKLFAAYLNNNFQESSGVLPFLFPKSLTDDNTVGSLTLSVNTTAYISAFLVPGRITVTKIHFRVSTYTATGTVKIGVYSSDGQTKLIDVTSGTISATGLVTVSVSSVYLKPGMYYLAVVPTGTTNIQVRSIIPQAIYNSEGFNNPTSEPVAYGTMTVTAGTLPTTFNPVSGITAGSSGLVITRFDS